jgi:hypothetical protein
LAEVGRRIEVASRNDQLWAGASRSCPN